MHITCNVYTILFVGLYENSKPDLPVSITLWAAIDVGVVGATEDDVDANANARIASLAVALL